MHRGWLRHLIVLASVGAALLLRLALDPYLGDLQQFSTFFAAVAIAAWVGGYRLAIAATVLSYVTADWFFIEPRYTLHIFNYHPEELVGLGTFVFASTVITAFSEAMRRSRQQAQDEAELRRVTLTSIGDAVIVTDVEGRVTALNPVAESLTGWSGREASAQPIGRVFHIENEYTGQIAEDPVARVLREKKVVGLANHTVLLAKNGTRRPIDDSGAPIVDDQGKLHGVVLVFRDITERRRAEDEIRSLSLFPEENPHPIMRITWDGILVYANSSSRPLMAAWSFQVGQPVSDEWQRRVAGVLESRAVTKIEATAEEVVYQIVLVPLAEPGYVNLYASEITERKRAEEALREADRRKDEFLAMLGHELRNPLAAISNGVRLLGANTDQAAVWVLESIQRQTRHLARLLDDLLDVARITRGKIELRREYVRLPAIVAASVESVRELIQERRHQLHVSVAQEPLGVWGDRVRLEQVLVNLLANAAKYTDEGGQIWLGAEREENEVVLCVKDNGAGIPREMLSQIFELFGQVESSLHRAQGGLGIGLTLASRLIELHGGSIQATSEGPGRGSEFVVRLPAASGPPPEETAEAASPAAATSCRLRILLAEDNQDAAAVLAAVLCQSGHDVETVHDGPAAVEAARRSRPEVAILDLGLPGLDGYQVARRLRARKELQGMMLIALSGYGQEQDRAKSRESGFDHHLLKPAEHEALVALLAQARRTHARKPSYRILLIDDNRMLADLTAEVLEEEGHSVTIAHDGPSGLAKAGEVRPDLVLCDLSLAGAQDGHSVARVLRADPAFSRTCLIALTGYGEAECRQTALESGFNGYLTKPMDLGELERAVCAWQGRE